jgi:hypothetical protein
VIEPQIIRISEMFGTVQIVPVQELRNGRLYMGGYSIRRDRHGREVSRTEVTWNGSLGFDDGSPVTAKQIEAWRVPSS